MKTGKFLAAAGDYRIELRAGKTTVAFTVVTVASSFEGAIVNACEPLAMPAGSVPQLNIQKTGPGR